MLTEQLKIERESPKLGEGIYTISDVAFILRITKSNARYLVKKYLNDLIKDQEQFDYLLHEHDYVINFYSLIEVYVIYNMRKNGLSVKNILSLHNYLSKLLDTHYPFANTEWLVSGKEIYFDRKQNWITADGKLQFAINDIVEHFGTKIQFDNNKLASQFYPLGKERNIVVDPQHKFGLPIIKDTNLVAEYLYDTYIAEDKNLGYVAQLYDISEQQLMDVVEYMAAA
jgi:uncharacterized protein (DUF433 family)